MKGAVAFASVLVTSFRLESQWRGCSSCRSPWCDHRFCGSKPRLPFQVVGFFGSGCHSGYPNWLITRSTSDSPLRTLANPFDCARIDSNAIKPRVNICAPQIVSGTPKKGLCAILRHGAYHCSESIIRRGPRLNECLALSQTLGQIIAKRLNCTWMKWTECSRTKCSRTKCSSSRSPEASLY